MEATKNENNKAAAKLKTMLISAIAMVIMGCALMIAGFIVPPTGEIHGSVLTAVGECLTFAGSIFGINTNYRIKTNEWEMERKRGKETKKKKDE